MFDTVERTAVKIQEATSGRIGPITFPSLIHDVCEEKNTGALTLRDGEVEKAIYIDRGRIVFARSNFQDDRLGTLMLRRGMIRLKDLEEAARISQETGQRLGGVLVGKQIVRPQDLMAGVRNQVMEIVISLFHWTRGAYHLVAGPLPSDEVITLKISTEDMVLEGVKRIESWSRIKLAVGGWGTRYQVSPRLEELARGMTLSLDEWTMLSRCEGPISLGQLCEASGLRDFEVCRLVWAFLVVGALRRLD